jgi:ABC-type antimicrobial peptide transport system permease subunit
MDSRQALAQGAAYPLQVSPSLSWLIAVVVGIPAAYGFVLLLGRVLATLPFALDPISLIWMLVFILVVASVASIGPVVGVARLSIAETLKYE